MIFYLLSPNDQKVENFQNCTVAYNDIASYHPHGIKGYNDLDIRIKDASANNLNKQFDEPFYALWKIEEKNDRKAAIKRAQEIAKNDFNCVNYDHVNQCMSVCSGTDNCTGFFIDNPGKCCMITNPPLEYYRDRWNIPVDNTHVYGNAILNNLIKDSGKVVFTKVGSDGFNDVYNTDMSRKECHRLCPKCIIGKCPTNYRCTNLMADPRYDRTCLITNEDRYDETKGFMFDNENIPYLDSRYAINEFAWYNDLNTDPIINYPETHKIELTDRKVITPKEMNVTEHFDQWVNRNDCFDPETASDQMDFIATRGGNDPINLNSYYSRFQRVYPRTKRISADIVEENIN